MPSSLMIVALAAAWLVVLVPMIARKRQEIARTGEDDLAARVVRSPRARNTEREESRMSDSAEQSAHTEGDEEPVGVAAAGDQGYATETDARESREEPQREPWDGRVSGEREIEPDDAEQDADRGTHRHRAGRGGFDPEAAEIAARAKYVIRQRVVLALLATVLLTALLAGFVHASLWWVNGAAIVGLAGYLGYLRRQVRIENDIRQRRTARMGGSRPSGRAMRTPHGEADEDEYDVGSDREPGTSEGEPTPLRASDREQLEHVRRRRRDAEVLDLDDEDPAFHELDEPSYPEYRKAVGE